MYIFGDIGNSETKVFLLSSNFKIKKNISFNTKKINTKLLNKRFNYLIKDYSKIEKILFCSVVPKSFYSIKKFLTKKSKKKML